MKLNLSMKNKLNIITPCSRPQNLSLLLESIQIANNDQFDITWYIIFDASEIPKLDPALNQAYSNLIIKLDKIKNHNSVAGNCQRNLALDQISGGFVYFLDDDNLMHPDLLNIATNLIKIHGEEIIIVGKQLLSNGHVRNIGSHLIIPGSIDIAQVFLHRNLIGNKKWPLPYYNADGRFLENIHLVNYLKFIFIERVIAYYNKLKK